MDDARFIQQMERQMLESWVEQPAAALTRLGQMHELLREGLTKARSAAKSLLIAIASIAVAAVLSILLVPWRGDAVLSSASEATARLLAHYPLATSLCVVECFLFAWRAGALRRIRDYENRLAFFSEMDVVVSAAIILKRPEALDRSMEALAAAQKDGVLYTPHTHTLRSRAGVGLLAGLLRNLIR
jgi:hypothetical protein